MLAVGRRRIERRRPRARAGPVGGHRRQGRGDREKQGKEKTAHGQKVSTTLPKME
jgi:hypothetical protein